jgi:ribonuclease G
LLVKQNEKDLVLALHPYLHAYFTKGFFSQRVKWYLKFKRWVNLVVDTSLGVTEFKFLNKEGEEIQLNN